MTGEPSRPHWLKATLALSAVALFSYVSGVCSAGLETFPYPQLLEAPFTALEASRRQSQTLSSVLNTNLWLPERYDGRGVTIHDPERARQGYTFYTGAGPYARLIDMKGNVRHEWRLPFREAWPDPPHADDPPPEGYIYWRARLLADGDVVAIYATPADTPYGYGLVRIDRQSEIVWRFADRVHHDVAIRDDGAVYALTHNFRDLRNEPLPSVPQLPNTVLKDDIVLVSPQGRELKRLSLLELFVESDYREMLQMFDARSKNPASGHTKWDVLHTNAVTIVGSDFAEHHDFAEPGQLMVSFRGFDAIALIDFEAEKLVWAARGFWSDHHDPDPLPNGNVLVFDNKGYGGPEGPSRIVEMNPSTQAIEWSYLGSSEYPLWSRRRASQQPLPNGHVLITSTEEGRIFEVTRDGDIVWNFINPELKIASDGQRHVGMVNSGRRVAADQVSFLPEGNDEQ